MTAGLSGDGEWPGADTGCEGIPKPQDTLGFAERELSLAPAGGCACAGCTQCSHMEMCQCRVAPLMSPCHHPTLPPSRPHHVVLSLCADHVAGGTAQLQVMNKQHQGLFPSSLDFGELFSCRRVRGSRTVGLRVAHL